MLSGRDVPHILRGIPWPACPSLIKRNGAFVQQRWPTGDELNQLEVGIEYFLGGYVYSGIAQDVADVLVASGFGEGLTEE